MKCGRGFPFEEGSATRALLIAVISALFSGCAGQDAYRLGEEQLATRQWEKAIASFSLANQQEPGNLSYKAALSRSTSQAVDALLSEAAALREKQPIQARDVFKRVLQIDPNNERAAAGLEAFETYQRQQRLFAEATSALNAGREQEARAKFKKLLDEKPSHEGARAALRDMDAKSGKASARPVIDPEFRKPVSMVFRDATLKMVFNALADSTGINFVFDRDLKQDARISVVLRDIAFEEALEQITSANGLARRVVSANTLLIYPARPDKVKEYQDLTIRNFFVANADVKQLSGLLKAVLKVKDMFTDEKRNLIVIRDTPEMVALAEKMVAAHDQPEPEVMLEVEILEFNHATDNTLGLKFPDQVSFGIASPLTLSALRSLTDADVKVTGLDTALAINLKRQVGDVNLLANPRIRVRNHEKAKFHIGDKVPVITSTTYPGLTTGAVSSSVSYLEVGIKLEFEPSIQLDNDVVIKTQLEVSSITKEVVNAGTTAYQVGTRNATTTLTLRDGETQVLAGLLSTDESDTSNRLPGLGDVPALGNLFSSRSTKRGRKEILLSITPRIVRNLTRPTDDLIEMNFGPEAGGQGGSGISSTSSQSPTRSASPAPVRQLGQPSPSQVPTTSTAPTPTSGLTPTTTVPKVSGSVTPAPAVNPVSPTSPAAAPEPYFEPPPGISPGR